MSRIPRKINQWFIPIPQQVYEPRTKVLIKDKNNNFINVSSDLISWSRVRMITDGIFSWVIRLANTDGKYIGEFPKGKAVEIYFDYNPNPGSSFTASTLILAGKIDSYKYAEDLSQGWVMELSGRNYPQITDKSTNMSFSGTIASDAIIAVVTDLNNLYGSTIITTTNVASNNEPIYMNYRSMPHWQIIKDICDRADVASFIDTSANLHTFSRNTIDDYENYAIVGVNVISVGEFGSSILNTKNYVKVVSQQEGVDFVWTSEDTTSQSETWIKGGEENDTGLVDINEAQDKADMIKNRSLLMETERGFITIVGNANLTPGYNIPCKVPFAGVDGMMELYTITDTYDISNGFTTSIQLNERVKTIATKFVTTKQDINNVSPVSNPNDMKYSFLMKFDKTTNTENFIATLPSGMSVTEGKLVMGTTSDTLTVISTQFTSPIDVTRAELLINGEQTTASTYQISFDAGAHYQIITPGIENAINITNTGAIGVLKINSTSNSSNTNPKWESVCVRWK